MTQQELASLAGARGWKCIGSNAYGVHRGYPFSVYLNTGRMSTLTVTFQLDRALKAKAVRALKKELPKGCSLAQPQVGTLHLMCAGPDGGLEELLRQGMDGVTAALSEQGLLPPEKCPYCKKTGCDALAAQGGARAKPNGNAANVAVGAAVGGMVGAAVAGSLSAPATGYVPVHRACVEERTAARAAHAQKNLVAGRYGRGALGGLLGALAGALPYIAIQAASYYMLPLLCILIPLGAWFGYKKLGGKRTMAAFWIVAAVTLLTTWVLTDQIVFYIILCDGELLNPLFTIGCFYDYFYLSEIISDLVYPTIWAGVGLLTVFGQCRKEKADTAIEDAGVAMDSLASYTPRGRVEL